MEKTLLQTEDIQKKDNSVLFNKKDNDVTNLTEADIEEYKAAALSIRDEFLDLLRS